MIQKKRIIIRRPIARPPRRNPPHLEKITRAKQIQRIRQLQKTLAIEKMKLRNFNPRVVRRRR